MMRGDRFAGLGEEGRGEELRCEEGEERRSEEGMGMQGMHSKTWKQLLTWHAVAWTHEVDLVLG